MPMAGESSLSSLFRVLKLDEPWLPPKPWESVASEGGTDRTAMPAAAPAEPAYDPSTVSEAALARLAINALQGIESALGSIERIYTVFCANPSDRTSHRVPTLWYRSVSTYALARILKSVANVGLVNLFLRKFVDFFLGLNWVQTKEDTWEEDSTHPPFSLVNQAFAVAVEKVLCEYICALNSLNSSIQLRRQGKASDGLAKASNQGGCLTTVVHSDISLLEVYLHTKELQIHMEALGNICFFKDTRILSFGEGLPADMALRFYNFPRGADLLTYLYLRLQDADPVHRSLLMFLFVRSFEPYCGFIKSWIYKASIDDPYKEFIVEHYDNAKPGIHVAAARTDDLFGSSKERDGVAVPCFLKDVCRSLFRAGQQLHILVKLLDICNWDITHDESHSAGTDSRFSSSTLEEVLPYWNDSSCESAPCLLPLTFKRRNMEAMMLKREQMYKQMQDKLNKFLPRLTLRCWHIKSAMVPTLPRSLTPDEDIAFPISTLDKTSNNLDSGFKSFDASSTSSDDFSEDHQSSECSSVDNFEEQGNGDATELHGILSTAKLGKWCSSTHFCTKSLSAGDNLLLPESNSEKALGEVVLDSNEDIFGELKWGRTSELNVDYPFGFCCPFAGLLRTPFLAEDRSHTLPELQLTGHCISSTDTDIQMFENEELYSDGLFDFSSFGKKPGKDIVNYEMVKAPNLLYKYNIFSVNPLLTKRARFGLSCYSREGGSMESQNFLPYFDFTSVEDACKMYRRRLGLYQNHILHAASGHFPFEEVRESLVGLHKGEEAERFLIKGEHFCTGEIQKSVLSSTESKPKELEECYQTATSGGSAWESLLCYSGKSNSYTEDLSYYPEDEFEIPLEIVVNGYIVQEILLQYKYISNFTIKMLEEGFDLQGHLLALRRYHFMEFADWADSFILSLWHQRMYIPEVNQRISEIQGFLDLALQRSSCENDLYRERLFIYAKEKDEISSSTSAFGIRAFDVISLGYRVDWPINIVLTPDALKIYTDIFTFLIQVKLALFSLNDVWRSFKEMMHQRCNLDDLQTKWFSFLMKMRQQLNHFVSTLHQYVLSQLSHVSWCRLLQSLKHQVKDMLDLESVHMTYLTDALHICFLSPEMRNVASIIEGILQCSLDFQSCFTRSISKDGSVEEGTSISLPLVNFSKVFSIKVTFEKFLKDLYVCYLKSPKYREFGLSHFWDYLNYNEFY